MKNNKIIKILLTTAMIFGVGAQVGMATGALPMMGINNRVCAEDTVINFTSGTTTSDSTTALTNDSAPSSIETNSFISSVTSVSKVYQAKSGYGWKFGTSSAVGSITFSISETNIKSIVLNVAKFGSDSGVFKVNNKTGTGTMGSDFSNFTYTIDDTISSITIATSAKRGYLKSMTIVPVNENETFTLSGIELSGTPTNKFYYVGDTFNKSGITVSTVYTSSIDGNDPKKEDITSDTSIVWPDKITSTSLDDLQVSYKVGEKTYSASLNSLDIDVKAKLTGLEGQGTLDAPYTADDVIKLIDGAEGNITVPYYFTGIAGEITQYNKNNVGNITFNLLNNQLVDTNFVVFRALDADGNQYTSSTINDVKAGELVVVYGSLQLYTKDGTSTYESTAGAKIISHTTYTPSFTQCTATLVYNNGSANGQLLSNTSTNKYEKPSEVTNGDLVFRGWYTDVNFENEYNFNTVAVDGITLYAKWSQKGYACFYFQTENTEDDEIIEYYVGEKLSPISKDVKKTGYAFAGWYTEEECFNKFDFDSATTVDEIELYAKWNLDLENHFQDNLNLMESHVTLAYKYSCNVSTTTVLDNEITAVNQDNGTISATEDSISSYFNGSTDLTIFGIKNDATSFVYADGDYIPNSGAGKGKIRLYKGANESLNGSALIISSKTGKILDVSVNDIKVGSEDTIKCVVENGVATIQNISTDLTVGFDSISISYTKNTYSDFKDVQFRIKVAVENLEVIDYIDTCYEYGIYVECGSIKKYYSGEKLHETEDGNLLYSIINLGDVITNQSRATDKYIVKSYVKITKESEPIFSTYKCEYSIVDMVKEYYSGEKSTESSRRLVQNLYYYYESIGLITD